MKKEDCKFGEPGRNCMPFERIEINFKTPSVNHLYFNWQNRRILTKEARKLKEEIIKIVQEQVKNPIPEALLKVSVFVYEDWFTLQNKIARKDIANREKFLIDSIFQGLKIDDKYIFEHVLKKVQSEDTQKTEVIIEWSSTY
jgi:Holliday junction resolvase RusA-like endonuclease